MNSARGYGARYADPLVFLAKSHQSLSVSPRSKKIGALLPAHSRSNPQSSEKAFRTSEFPPTGTPSFQALMSCALSLFRLVPSTDRKSTRLNSSHGYISYAVFCLKKYNQQRLLGQIDALLLHIAGVVV